MIKLEEALRIIEHQSTKTMDIEQVVLENVCGRVLAETAYSDMDFPSFNKSAMDGYAIRKNDIRKKLKVIEFIPAGQKPERKIVPGTCANIMTGAMLPKGADMVVMQEDVMVENETISITNLNSKTNILWQAEDVKEGDMILKKGTCLNPVHIGLLASIGISQPSVYKKPVIAILSSGDELVNPNETPKPPKIRNSNAVQLESLAKSLGAQTINLGHVGDNKKAIFKAIQKAVEISDIVVMTGGASVGDLDFTAEVFSALKAETHFTKLAIQPGKPALFASFGEKFLFGLSGNPVSSYVQFQLIVKPLLYIVSGNKANQKVLKLPLSIDRNRKRSERMLFFPIRINKDMEAEPLDYHGSAHLNAYQLADGMACFPVGIKEIKKGRIIDVRPL